MLEWFDGRVDLDTPAFWLMINPVLFIDQVWIYRLLQRVG